MPQKKRIRHEADGGEDRNKRAATRKKTRINESKAKDAAKTAQKAKTAKTTEEDLSAEGTVNNPENDLFAVNEAVFREAVETTKTNNVKLKTYFLSDERAGDMLFFPKDRLPWFEISRDGRGRRLETEGAPHQQQQQAGQPKRSRTVTHVSDKQVQCICSLRPQLMFPEGTSGWRFQDMGGPVCQAVRNTTGAKKELENYKYTGFCKDHVEGKGAGSRQTWEKHDKTSVRGFNLERKDGRKEPPGQRSCSSPRHILCLETNNGLVFLKWCTQCHLWKNFAEFTERAKGDNGPNDLLVHTFCKVCHQRDVLYRDKHKRRRQEMKAAMEDGDWVLVEKGDWILVGMGGYNMPWQPWEDEVLMHLVPRHAPTSSHRFDEAAGLLKRSPDAVETQWKKAGRCEAGSKKLQDFVEDVDGDRGAYFSTGKELKQASDLALELHRSLILNGEKRLLDHLILTFYNPKFRLTDAHIEEARTTNALRLSSKGSCIIRGLVKS